jgi:hypothetical protein
MSVGAALGGRFEQKNLGLNVVQMKEIHYLCADKS